MLTIYHNPRCSKSRATLRLLEQNKLAHKVILYLDYPPCVTELKSICSKLDVDVMDIVRQSESVCQELGEVDDWFETLHAHPILIQRPIVVSESHAVIGRPPENVLVFIPK